MPPEAGQDAGHRKALESAWAGLLADPSDLEALIWYGRRTAYLGAMERAIEIYSWGLAGPHPNEARLLRHRGHRHISTGDFAAAERDLARAAERIEGSADRVEADGLPNDRNEPTSTLHTNVHYHLGLTQYLRGDFAAAEASYARCLAVAEHLDMQTAARYWLVLARRRQGLGVSAALSWVDADADIIENHAYQALLLLFRGDRSRAEIEAEFGGEDGVGSATLAYGIARHAFSSGEEEEGLRRLRAVVASGAPRAFGTIAAAADLAALDG